MTRWDAGTLALLAAWWLGGLVAAAFGQPAVIAAVAVASILVLPLIVEAWDWDSR